MTDQEMITLLEKQPSEGLRVIMKAYGALVRYIVTRILGEKQKQDIEECMSDVFCELWRQLDKFDPSKESLKNYIVGIARYKALNNYRKLAKDLERNISIEEDEVYVENDLEKSILTKLDAATLQGVIDELEEPDRQIIIKRYFWFEKVCDIAKQFGLETKQVENKLYRGKLKIKQGLLAKGVSCGE